MVCFSPLFYGDITPNILPLKSITFSFRLPYCAIRPRLGTFVWQGHTRSSAPSFNFFCHSLLIGHSPSRYWMSSCSDTFCRLFGTNPWAVLHWLRLYTTSVRFTRLTVFFVWSMGLVYCHEYQIPTTRFSSTVAKYFGFSQYIAIHCSIRDCFVFLTVLSTETPMKWHNHTHFGNVCLDPQHCSIL